MVWSANGLADPLRVLLFSRFAANSNDSFKKGDNEYRALKDLTDVSTA